MRNYQGRQYSIVPYDPEWPRWFAREADPVRREFGTDADDVQHVGSTAVPGMAGKPTIDILVTVGDLAAGDRHVPGMQALGYEAMGEYVTGDSRLFVKQDGPVRLVNLHVFPSAHPHAKEMLELRDYFREHPEAVKEYSELKNKLYREFPEDYGEYRRQKDIWMEELKERLRDHGVI
jgi:GrpB-like predicted nucleotidyltransferase (UPF0157 family)